MADKPGQDLVVTGREAQQVGYSFDVPLEVLA